MTVASLLSEARAALDAAGVPSPEWDAERLLRHVLGWDRASLLARPDQTIGAEAEARFRGLVGKRARRVPLQHLVGKQAFWKHEFVVSLDVLIPRPETELLVEASLELIWRLERPLVVDVGTGSGCIGLSLAAEREDVFVHAVDVSAAALGVARENARRLGVESRVAFHQGDLLAPVAHLAGRFDLVASNPPYVELAEREGLAPEVKDHDPEVALFAPEGALSTYRRLATESRDVLRPGGWLAVEVPPAAASSVTLLLVESGFHDTSVLRDLEGRARVVQARIAETPSARTLG